MPVYQIHRMKDVPRQQFRWAPHTSGVTVVKPRDFEPGPTIEAATCYAAWIALREGGTPLEIGDILEEEGNLRILKYIGFEEARWFVPEPVVHKGTSDPVATETGVAEAAGAGAAG